MESRTFIPFDNLFKLKTNFSSVATDELREMFVFDLKQINDGSKSISFSGKLKKTLKTCFERSDVLTLT